jgi:hypothetical protein
MSGGQLSEGESREWNSLTSFDAAEWSVDTDPNEAFPGMP